MNPVLLTELLIGTRWDDILDQDLDSATEDFTNTILNAASIAIPKREITVRSTDKSWVTGELRRCIRRRERLFRRAKRTDCPSDWDKWRRQRSATTDLNKRLKRSYLIKQSQQLISQKQNPRKYHAILKQMIGRRKISQIPPLEKADGELITEERDKAELLNYHFARQSTSERLTSFPPHTGLNVPQLDDIVVSEQEVLRELNSLNICKSCGPDMLPNKILKMVALLICEPVTKLFNKSLLEGRFPSSWKEARVTAIFKKKGSASHATNYRPISLLPCLSKVLERLVFKRIYQHISDNGLLSECQSGYRPTHSTQLQLIYLSHRLYEALNNGLDFTIVYLDVAKYFDRIPHEGLLFKCKYFFGVAGKVIDWLRSYLTDRQQRVVVGNEISGLQKLTAGCPQGSILGPLLALMYLNDVETVTSSPTLLFADDTAVFFAHKQNSLEAALQLQTHLDKIVQFGRTWGIAFNALKTVQQTFSTKRTSEALRLTFDGVLIETKTSHKHLGVTFSSDLRFHTHVNEVICKINRSLGPLYAIAEYLPRNTLNLVYKIYIRPIFDYCDVVYDSNLTVTDAIRLERTQLKIARLVTGAHRRSPTHNLLRDVGWETLKTRRAIHKLKILYKIKNKDIATPRYLDHVTLSTRTQTTRRILRNANSITAHQHHLTSFRNSFFPDAVSKWNSLSPDIQNQPTLKSFGRAVAKHHDVKQAPRYFSLGTKLGNKLNTRLRLKTSELNAHLFTIGYARSPQCACGYNNEGSEHFILHCPKFAQLRLILFQSLANIIPGFARLPDDVKIDMLIKGYHLVKGQEQPVAASFQSFLI